MIARQPYRQSAPLLRLLSFVAIAVVFVRTAWVSDDAFISFRSADNLLHGYGLRWNVAERVQSFTNPLWTLIFAGVYALFRDPFAVAIGLSLVVSLTAVGFVAWRWTKDAWAGVAAIALLLSSRSFVDYSSSGLENPLVHLLLVGFFLCGRIGSPSRRLFMQSLMAGCAAFNRMDSVIILMPALAWSWWSAPRRAEGALRMVAGFAPFLLWEAFAIFYFGSPVPNTAFAKLSTGIPAGALAAQGLWYLWNSLTTDPLTLTTIALAIAAGIAVRTPERWAAIAGIVIHVVYVVKAGGDFMSGRFLASPFLLAVLVLTSTPLPRPAMAWPAFATGAVLLGFAAHPNLISGRSFGAMRTGVLDRHGVADERRFYFPAGGWLNQVTGVQKPFASVCADARLVRTAGVRVVVGGAIGWYGFYAGPGIHIIDYHALADPLLARLPIVDHDPLYETFGSNLSPPVRTSDWRIGHFLRALPPGYLATIVCGKNRITDARLAKLYDRIALVTRGRLTDPRRLREIVRLNLDTGDRIARREAPRTWELPNWDEVLACRPDDPDAVVGRAAQDNDETAERDIATLRSELERRPDDPIVLLALARRLKQLDSLEAAARTFARVTQVAASYAPACHQLGVTLALLGDRDGATAAFRKEVQNDPTSDGGFRSLAVQLIKVGRLDEAETALRRAVSLNDGVADAWFYLAIILRDRGRFEESVTMLRRAVACAPDNPMMNKALADGLATLGRHAEAGKYAARARQAAARDTAGRAGP